MIELTAGYNSTFQRHKKIERERQPKKKKNESIDEKDRSLWSIPNSSKFSFDLRLFLF